jgi:hypothetical protein
MRGAMSILSESNHGGGGIVGFRNLVGFKRKMRRSRRGVNNENFIFRKDATDIKELSLMLYIGVGVRVIYVGVEGVRVNVNEAGILGDFGV